MDVFFPSTNLLMADFKTPQRLVYKFDIKVWRRNSNLHQLKYTLYIKDEMPNNQSFKL